MMYPTIPIDEVCERTWDVAVVGAGPAGSVAAYLFVRQGHSVLLIDKADFPREKVCGGCVNVRAQHALDHAGLGGVLDALDTPMLDTFTVAARGRTASIPLPGYRGVTRESLDNALVERCIDAKVTFLPATRVQSSHAEDGSRVLSVTHGELQYDIAARVVVAADGLGGVLARKTQQVSDDSRIGGGLILRDAPAEFKVGHIYMACGAHGYVGLTHVEQGRIDIAAAYDADLVRDAGGLGPAAARVFEQAGFSAWPELANGPWKGTPPLTRSNSELSAERLFVIGDAAGYVEPFTGEGIAWAVGTGIAVAPIASEAVKNWDRTLQSKWRREYRRVISGRQYLCRALAYALRRPRLVRAGVGVLSKMPQIAKPFVSTINAPVSVTSPRS